MSYNALVVQVTGTTRTMYGITKFSALAVTAASAVVILVLAQAWLGPAEDEVAAASFPTLFDEGLVQDIYGRVSPAVVVVKADLRFGESYGRIAIGSGFLIDGEGHIATNYHVVRGADRVMLDFQDSTTAEAAILGTSPGNDLALLKVDAASVAHIEPVELGDSSAANPGQMAIGIGSPFGLGGSVTVGIIGGIDRVLGSDIARPMHGNLQTDALTNPGDSGGPLLNRAGQVVGINTSVRIEDLGAGNQRASRPMGFALPVNTLVRLLPRLKDSQSTEPTYLGIVGTPVSDLLARRLNLPTRTGIYVSRVVLDSPAHLAGLIPSGTVGQAQLAAGGDTIIAVDGIPVDSLSGFFAELDRHLPGTDVPLTVYRGSGKGKIVVTLGDWPAGENPFAKYPTFPVPGSAGTHATRYPMIPNVPGFAFPDLFPYSPPN